MNPPEYDADTAEMERERREAMHEAWDEESKEIDRLERLATIEAQESDEAWLNRWARDERDL